MPFYQKQGQFPHKRHTQFRKENGELYHEELFGTIGFDGMSSLLYHNHPPTMVKEVGESIDIAPKIAVEKNMKAYRLKGFNVKPTDSARKLSEKEQIDIRFYSIIYDAINELKDAMEGMLSLEMKEESTGEAEVRETFKISRIGTIAGCMVTSGKIFRNSNVRVVRSEEIIFEGKLLSLKRFKDDVKEVQSGTECGIGVKDYNDVKPGDQIEVFKRTEIKRTIQ